MANWTCDICSISMHMNNQYSHLAGMGHATRAEEILAAGTRARVADRQASNPNHSNWSSGSSNPSGGNRPLPPRSTPFPAARPKQNSGSSPVGIGLTRAAMQNASAHRSKTRERGTQTDDEPTAVQAMPAVPPALITPDVALIAFKFQPEEIAKPLDIVSGYGSSYVLVWECQPCNRWMPLSSRAAHLTCPTHTGSLLRSLAISSPAAAQNQTHTSVPAPLYDMGETQPLDPIMHTSRLSTSQRVNATQSQGCVPEIKNFPAPKAKSTKPLYKCNTSQPPGLPTKAHRTTSKSSKTATSAPRTASTSLKTASTSSKTATMASKTATTASKNGSVPRATALFATCPHCKMVIATHKRAAHSCARLGPSTAAPKIGPLDGFFRSFPSFPYNAHKPPAESFKELLRGLRRWHDWNRSDPATWKGYLDDVMTRHQAALTREFNLWFGTEDKIECWHALCRALRVRPLPLNCKDCRSVVRGRHVNIVDLIEWARKGETERVQIFGTVKALSDYSYKNGKIYGRNQHGAGAVLSHLLREIRKEQRDQAYV